MSDNTSSWMDFAQRSRDDGGLGLASHQAAGLVGNLVNESGSGLPSWGPTGDNGSAWGTAQWRGDRLDSLKKAFPDSYQTPQAQQAFMRQEFDGPENSSYRALQAAQTPEDAASAVNHLYERSADRSGNREAAARALYQDGPTAIQAAMGGSRRPTGQAMGYAATNDDEADTPPNSAPTNGILSSAPGAGSLSSGGGWLGKISDAMINAAPGLASISNASQAQALAAVAAASKKTGGTWSTSGVDPKTGIAVQTNSLTGQTRNIQVHAPQEVERKWGIVSHDANGPVYGYTPSVEDYDKSAAAAPAQGANAVGPPQIGDFTKTGAEYLSTVPPTQQAVVQGMAEGLIPPPSGYKIGDPKLQALIGAAHQYDPTFDGTVWAGRTAGQKDWASGGKSADTAKSLNQSIGHLSDLPAKFDALNNGQSPAVNMVGNFVNQHVLGQTGVTGFKLNAHAVADELGKLFKGAGLSDREIKQWEEGLGENMSPPQQRESMSTLSGLVQHSMSALEEKRRQAIGPMAAARKGPLLSPEASTALDSLNKWATPPAPTSPTAPRKTSSGVPWSIN